MPPPRTITDKILDAHTIAVEGGRNLLYIDRIVLADTALGALRTLKAEGRSIRNPSQVVLISDHYAPSAGPTIDALPDPATRTLVIETEAVARTAGIPVLGVGDPRQGIQHGVSIDQGYAQPGLTLAAADSHSGTQGAIGALAISIGPNLPHVLTSQCIWIKRPRNMRIRLEGQTARGVVAKDVALALIASLGINGASGHVVEFAGAFTTGASIDARMTLCNLATELGAVSAIVSPDEKVFAFLSVRPLAPTGKDLETASAFWRSLPTDPDAVFDRDITFEVASVAPMVTWGNSTGDALPIDGRIPDPDDEADPARSAQMTKALDYMGLTPAMRMTDIPLDQVFIGSCANSQMEDLRAVAAVLKGGKVRVPTLIVPGSSPIRRQAEAEGLAAIFRYAGAVWGESGCSMCVSMNGDTVKPGARCASTSNRNHIGRQGRGSRTHLVSPLTAAASALAGRIADVRDLEAKNGTL